MIKTFNINLAGQIFNINEDAYEHLSGYFSSLRNFYRDEEEKEEIIRDIEARFAELFLAKGKNYIVTKEDTVAVVNTMGNPYEFDEDHAGQSTSSSSSATSSAQTVYTTGKRLYRDVDNSVVAGVCSGLSSYFGINDPIWIRILFIALTFFTIGGWMLLVYPILWFIIPEAVTSAQKLEMKGEMINVSSIERQVKDETIPGKPKGFFDQLVGLLGSAVRIFFKVVLWIGIAVAVLVGAAIVLSLVALLISLTIIALVGIPFVNEFFFINPTDGWLFGLGGLLTGLMPIILIVLVLVHVLSKKLKPLKKRILFPLFGLFMFGLLLLNISGFHAKNLVDQRKRVTQSFPLNYDYKSDTLQISMNPAIRSDQYNDVHIDGIHDFISFITEHEDKIIPVEVEVLPSATDSFSVVKEYSASGSNEQDAIRNATAFTHNISQRNNKLVIDPYIQFDENGKTKFRNQKLKIKVYVPEGKIIRWDERTERYMNVKKFAFNWDNIKDEEQYRQKLIVNIGGNRPGLSTPPVPPTPPTPGTITIKIDPNSDPDEAMQRAQEKLDQAREKLDRARERLDRNRDYMDDRQSEQLDSIDEIIETRFQREHYIFKMVNGELVAID